MKTIKFTVSSAQMEQYQMDRGWGNGYVAVPPEHRLHGYSYDSDVVNSAGISVHGGLTYSGTDLITKPDYVPSDWWIFGWDTAHYGDDLKSCSKEYVEKENEELKQRLEEIGGWTVQQLKDELIAIKERIEEIL